MQKTQEQKETEIARLKAWIRKLMPEHYDKIDVTSEYDSTLTYEENKSHFRELFKGQLTTLKEQVEHAKAEQERLETKKIQAAEREAEEYNKTLRYDDNKEVDSFYKPVYRVINKLCQGYSNLAFIKGRGGIGKSRNIRKALITNNADFFEATGEITEAYLYRLIFENNGKIIWLKDICKLLQAQGSLNLLKAATETEDKRILTKSSYSKEQKDLPDVFVCKAKFIFDYNNLYGAGGLATDFEALVSRGDYVELSFCDEEISAIMNLIAVEPWQREVTEYLLEKHKESGLVRLNLRTQWKAFKTYEYAKANNLDWKGEIDDELKRINKIRALLYSLIGDKWLRTADLKRKLLRLEIVGTLRTADNKINEWLYVEELWKVSEDEKNFYVSINPRKMERV